MNNGFFLCAFIEILFRLKNIANTSIRIEFGKTAGTKLTVFKLSGR